MKCLLIIEDEKYCDRAIGVLNCMDIKYEQTGLRRFNIWTSEENVKHLNETFEYMACIRTDEV